MKEWVTERYIIIYHKSQDQKIINEKISEELGAIVGTIYKKIMDYCKDNKELIPHQKDLDFSDVQHILAHIYGIIERVADLTISGDYRFIEIKDDCFKEIIFL